MSNVDFNVICIGGGPAGMAAALSAHAQEARVAIIERNARLGGILRQCIHPGFGLSHFKEELTGPEYAQRFINQVAAEQDIEVLCNHMVIAIDAEAAGGEGDVHAVDVMGEDGMRRLTCRSIVLAMGCRERTRSEIKIPGSRPAGVFTAGLAQRYLNIENRMPGHRAVILGSGDIGLIMARRCALEGIEVEGVYELMPYANGLARNVVNCLDDFGIPLHLSHTVTRVIGGTRLTAVEVSQVDESLAPIPGTERIIPCDTLLLSVGLIPETELAVGAGVELDPRCRGPKVDQSLMTSVPGIFSCGNVLHVHDLADNVSAEAARAGEEAARWAQEKAPVAEESRIDGFNDAGDSSIAVTPAGLAGYAVPGTITARDKRVDVFFRVRKPVECACAKVTSEGKTLFQGKPRAYKPSIMEHVPLTPKMLEQAGTSIQFSIEPVEEA